MASSWLPASGAAKVDQAIDKRGDVELQSEVSVLLHPSAVRLCCEALAAFSCDTGARCTRLTPASFGRQTTPRGWRSLGAQTS